MFPTLARVACPLLLALLLVNAGRAVAEESQSENYCHDPAIWAKIDDLLKQHPRDPLVIRSYALRLGICRLIDDGKISLEQGIELFDLEKRRAIMERGAEAERKKRPKGIPAEDVEPQG